MCRSIKPLRKGTEIAATEDEVRAAARQFVKKVSGFPKPSRKNEAAFEAAIDEVALATRRLLEAVTAAPALAEAGS